MKAHIDSGLCEGYANCVMEAEQIFDIDEATGQAVILRTELPAELEDDARRAQESCPARAIRLDG